MRCLIISDTTTHSKYWYYKYVQLLGGAKTYFRPPTFHIGGGGAAPPRPPAFYASGCVSCVWMLQRGHSGDGCVLASTLCKYDLRKGDLFVLSWARVRRVRRGSISSELLVCGGAVRSILLLPLVARYLETIDVCIWRMFVFMSVVVTVWGSVGMFVV